MNDMKDINYSNLKADVDRAYALLGKTVKHGEYGLSMKAVGFSVITTLIEAQASSLLVLEDFKTDGYSVAMNGTHGVLKSLKSIIPVRFLKQEAMRTVPLNENFSAEVFINKIVVGGEEFPVTIIQALRNAHTSVLLIEASNKIKSNHESIDDADPL